MEENRKKIFKTFALLVFCILIISYVYFLFYDKENISEVISEDCRVEKGGVVLSFDDLSVEGWYAAHLDIFEPRGVKATFYLTHLFKLEEDSESLEKLLQMQDYGHEMANHTMNHLNLKEFLLKNTLEEYLEKEVDSVYELGKFLGLNLLSFSYPFGVGTENADMLLLEKYSSVRYTGTLTSKSNRIFTDNICERILSAGSLDFRRGVSKKDITEVLKRAKNENLIVLMYGHSIAVEEPSNYSVSYEMLNHLIDEAERLNLEFFTVSEVFGGN